MNELRTQNEKEPDMPKGGVVRLLISLAALCLLAWSVWHVAGIWTQDRTDARRTLHLQTYAYVPEQNMEMGSVSGVPRKENDVQDAAEDAPLVVTGELTAQQDEEPPLQAARVDFAAVCAEAPDTRAWIRIPGTNIHYPIVQADDNEYYLTHSPDGELSRSGAIFIDARCAPDFGDCNTILYGHRMNSDTMFAQLHRYADREFLVRHPDIYITLPDCTLAYEVVSCQIVRASLQHPVYRLQFEDADDFVRWQQRERDGLLGARRTQCGPNERYLTLSTCVRGDAASRLVVQARLRQIWV